MANFSAEPARAEIDDAAAWTSAELLLTNAATPPSEDLVLGPWHAVVYRRTISP
jgi:oligo-1,6-glucosidase